MDILLDTHAVIWLFEGNVKMSEKAKKSINNLESRVYVSVASLWELAIKLKTGKLNFEGGLDGFVRAIFDNEFILLEIEIEHIRELVNLPLIHKDPFDRMIIAQSKVENLLIVTADTNILKYDNINYIW